MAIAIEGQVRRRGLRWVSCHGLLDLDDARDMLAWANGGFSLREFPGQYASLVAAASVSCPRQKQQWPSDPSPLLQASCVWTTDSRYRFAYFKAPLAMSAALFTAVSIALSFAESIIVSLAMSVAWSFTSPGAASLAASIA